MKCYVSFKKQISFVAIHNQQEIKNKITNTSFQCFTSFSECDEQMLNFSLVPNIFPDLTKYSAKVLHQKALFDSKQ